MNLNIVSFVKKGFVACLLMSSFAMYSVKVPRDAAAAAADAEIIATTIAQLKPWLSVVYSYAASHDRANIETARGAEKRIDDLLESLIGHHDMEFFRQLEDAIRTTEITGINLPARQIKDIPVMSLFIKQHFDYKVFHNLQIDQIKRALLENNIFRAKDLTERFMDTREYLPSYLLIKLYNEIPKQAYPMGVEERYFADYLVPKIHEYQMHATEFVGERIAEVLGEYDRIRHEKRSK